MKKRYNIKPRFYVICLLLFILPIEICHYIVWKAEKTPTVATYAESQVHTLPIVPEPALPPQPQLQGVTQEYYRLTEKEHELLVRVIAGEARGEPYLGQIAVAQVILDRCITTGMSVTQVLRARGQFCTPWPGDLESCPTVVEAVDEVFGFGVRAFEDVTTTFFNPQDADPATVKQLRKLPYIGRIGRHEFRGGAVQ